jgi:hypothetical protein
MSIKLLRTTFLVLTTFALIGRVYADDCWKHVLDYQCHEQWWDISCPCDCQGDVEIECRDSGPTDPMCTECDAQ